MSIIIISGQGYIDPIAKLLDFNKYKHQVLFPHEIGDGPCDVHFTNSLSQVAAKKEVKTLRFIMEKNPLNKLYKKTPGTENTKPEKFSLFKGQHLHFDHFLTTPKYFSYPLSQISPDLYFDLRLDPGTKQENLHLGNLQLTINKTLITQWCKKSFLDQKKKEFKISSKEELVIQISMMQGILTKVTKEVYLSEILTNLENVRIGVIYIAPDALKNVQIVMVAAFIRESSTKPEFPKPVLKKGQEYVEISLPEEDILLFWGADNKIADF
jgi:hypothetical protein